jgi:hypothetical protein
MTWFFDAVYRSSNEFDYAVESLSSGDVGAGIQRTTVVVRRAGEAIFPVDLVVTFENGEQVGERWDGSDRWKAYSFERPVAARSAQIDPERVLLLDVNYTNNSKTLAPKTTEAATKWSLKWMVWLQDLMLTWSALV